MKLERWQTFSKSRQLLFIGSELERARVWQYDNENNYKIALERAMELVDLTLQDKKWKSDSYQLLYLRNEIAKYYIGEATSGIGELYAAL